MSDLSYSGHCIPAFGDTFNEWSNPYRSKEKTFETKVLFLGERDCQILDIPPSIQLQFNSEH